MKFHDLRVAQTRSELGGEAVSITFEVPAHLQRTFTWLPGQHVTLDLKVDGQPVRRSYSISASHHAEDELRITVKRVEGGLVSNHLNDHARPGDVLKVAPPAGRFVLDPGANLRRTHYFIGAGSGITPLLSMIRSMLVAEPRSVAHLVYGNTRHDTILLQGELDALVAAYPGRLTVSHVLSRPSVWSGFTYWRGGIIDKLALEKLFAAHPPYAQDTQYYVCGPGSMNDDVRAALARLDVPEARIHSERYHVEVAEDDAQVATGATATVTLRGQIHTVTLDPGESVLHACERAGLAPSWSCKAGICGACMAQLTSGGVHMATHAALTDGEVEDGLILTCQATATTESIAVDYDDF